MNSKVTTVLFILTILILNACAHKRVKRMKLLTDTDYRTKHTDKFYTELFTPENEKKLFTKQADGTLIIRKQEDSFRINGEKYYWYGLIYSFWKSYKTCHYPAGNDPEMKNVRFADGSPVKSIMFGCWKHQRCCGTECCFETVIFTSVALILLLAGIFLLIRWIVQSANEIPLNEEVVIPLNERQ